MKQPLDRTFETDAGDPPAAFLGAVASRRRRRRAAQTGVSLAAFVLAVVAVLQVPSRRTRIAPPPVAMIDRLPIGPVDGGSIAYGLRVVPRLGDGLRVESSQSITDPF